MPSWVRWWAGIVWASAVACHVQPSPAPASPTIQAGRGRSGESTSSGSPAHGRAKDIDSLLGNFLTKLPPSPPLHPDRLSSQAFVELELRQWWNDCEAESVAISELALLMMRSPDNAEVVRGALAIAEMNVFLAERFGQAGRQAVPEEWARNSAKRLGYAESLTSITLPKFQLAYEALLFVQEAVGETSRDNSSLARFEELLARTTPAIERDEQPRVAFQPPEIADSVETASSVADSCEFQGVALELNALVETADASLAIGQVEAAGFESLTLPDTASGVYRARFGWPLRGEVRLHAERLLRLKEELPLVPSHIWYPAGAPLNVMKGKPGTALLVSDFAELEHVPAPKISCQKLSLQASESSRFLPSRTAKRLRKAEPLFRAPNGRPIAKIGGALSGVEVIAREGAWTQVRSENNPYVMFQGWLSDPEFEPEELELNEDPPRRVDARHRVQRDSTLYLGGVESDLLVAEGVPVKVLAIEWEFSLVLVPGIRAPRGVGYWLRSEDLGNTSERGASE